MTTMVGIVVEYKAKTSQLESSFAKVGKEMQQMKSKQDAVKTGFEDMHGKMSSGLSSITNRWKSIVAIIGGGLLVHAFNNIADSIDSVTDKARGLGMAGSDLQSLGYAAKQSGVDMDSLEMAISKMTVTLGQVQKGETKIKGLDLSKLAGQSSDQQFANIIKQLEGIESKGLQAAIAFDLFGKSYKDVLKIARDKGLSDSIGEFNKLGLALTESQRKAVDAFGDSKNRIEAIWNGLGEKIVAYVSPAFEKIVTFIGDVILKFGGIDIVAKSFSNAIVTGVQIAIKALNELLGVFGKIKSTGLAIDIFEVEAALRRNNGSEYDPNADVGLMQRRKMLYQQYNMQNGANENRTSSVGNLANSLNSVKYDINSPLGDFLEPVRLAGDKLADAFDKGADSIKKAGEKLDSYFARFVKSEGEKKLQSILGNPTETNIPQVQSDQLDRFIKSIYNKALTGTKDGYVPGQQTGYGRDSTAQEDFAKLSKMIDDAAKGGRAGEYTGYVGARDELKAFVDKMDSKTQKVDVAITVTPSDNFAFKVAQSDAFKKAVEQNQGAALSAAAASLSK